MSHRPAAKIPVWPFLAIALFLPRCSGNSPPTPDDSNIVAHVGKTTITRQEFTDALSRQGSPHSITADRRQEALEQLVRRQVELEAARSAGYDRHPAAVKAYERAMVAELRRERLDPQLESASVADQDIEDYYRTHPADFTAPARIRAAVIRMTIPTRARKEKKIELAERAERAREAALQIPAATPTFGSAAVRFSDDQTTRYRGGDTGWLDVDQVQKRWGPEFTTALLSLATPGDISPVITTDSAHYLIRLIERTDEQPRELKDVAAQIRHQLLGEKKASIEARYHAALRSDVEFSVDWERIRSIPVPTNPAVAADRRPPPLPK